jgi:hypothetical protein
MNEILRNAAGADDGEQARKFIEQLWEYDQIVFDATSSHRPLLSRTIRSPANTLE